MSQFVSINSQLQWSRFDVRIKASEDTYFDAWIGAVLRNNLLYATHQIILSESGISLFERILSYPLPKHHPLYGELKEGFPAPYYLYVHGDSVYLDYLAEGETLSFSLILIGELAAYINDFTEAIRWMCHKGLGCYSKPFVLSEIREVPVKGDTIRKHLKNIRIYFESPVCLSRPKKKEAKLSVYELNNFFPGFYQLVRTAAYRLEKLHALYAAPNDIERYLESHACIEAYLDHAFRIELEEASVRKVHLLSSKRKGGNEKRIPLIGYVGETAYRGDLGLYVPLLNMMEQLGIGHELTYGLGKIRIKI